jgi:MFS family permease
VLAYACVGWVAEAMEVMLLSFVGPSVKAEWGVSGAAEGLVSSVVFAGMLIGACLGGLISDRYGRRYPFIFFFPCSFLIATLQSKYIYFNFG